jgi:hypothetical protein
MKKSLLIALLFCVTIAHAQTYPSPEFSNEVYAYQKNTDSLIRLEKERSKMDTKTKMGGFGGVENSYSIEGERSPVRLSKSPPPSFIFSDGSSSKASSALSDSIMKANGVDPAMRSRIDAMGDPSNTVLLYKAESGKGNRKIIMQKVGGAFGGKKMQSADQYSFSVKKIRDGYWELVIDKPLPKGEYAFSVMNMGAGNADGSRLLFAFGVE